MTATSMIYHLPLDHIDFELYNRRCSVDTTSSDIQELAEDIAANGQLQPGIVVGPLQFRSWNYTEFGEDGSYHMKLVCGHRRWLALMSIERRTARPQTMAVTYWKGATESQVFRAIFSENNQRQSFLPSEEAKLEVEIRTRMLNEGLVSTKQRPAHGKPSYASVRAAELGVSERSIEQRVRLGVSTPALLNAADIGTVTKAGAFSLAAFDPSTQVHTLSYLEAEGISRANPQDVAAAVVAVRQRQGLPAIKNGEEYLPSVPTKTLGNQIQELERKVALLKFCVEYYAMGDVQGPELARKTLTSLDCSDNQKL